MDYSVYNDYELLYLIYDGSEAALNLLHKKYYHIIYTTVIMYYKSGPKANDLIQEGRILLQDCITSYRPKMGCSFYSYFLLCYKRKIFRLLKNEYYTDYLELNDNLSCENEHSINNTMSLAILLDTEEEKLMYQSIIVENMNLTDYAKSTNEAYMVVYRKYLKLLEKIKKDLF